MPNDFAPGLLDLEHGTLRPMHAGHLRDAPKGLTMAVCATRLLIVRSNGIDHPVIVTLSVPEPDRTAWVCRFEIGWPEGIVRDRGMGVDGVQALILAMQKVNSHLYASRYHHEGLLIWEKPSAGYGFPMSRGGRADLIGEDKAQYE